MVAIAARRVTARPALRYLVWDSNHFGFPVAQIVEPCLSERELADVLHRARRQETQLVYWAVHPEQAVPEDLLNEFSGFLADRKVTYHKPLAANPEAGTPAQAPGLVIRPYPQGPASPPLVALALAAGEHSRFRVDRRVPAGRFTGLYETWIQRSTRHELADAVLVATPTDRPEEIRGMITLSEAGGTGHIDLIAVNEATRGRGLGRQLLQAAETWMLARGARAAQVVTQRSNQPACGFYERTGYRVGDVKHVYHFWTQETGPMPGGSW